MATGVGRDFVNCVSYFFLWRQNAWSKKLKEETADFGSQLEKRVHRGGRGMTEGA